MELIPVCSPKRELEISRKEIESVIKKVLDGGKYILSEEVKKFEKAFAKYLRVKYAIGLNSGTDALFLALKENVGVGDEVIIPALTAPPTAVAVRMAGAVPVFADIDEKTLNIDIKSAESLISKRTKAIVPVHLYGNPADMKSICKLAKKNDLIVVEDACQAHGATYLGKKVGTFGHYGVFSFYPTKNLSCLGDGGMIVTNEELKAGRLRKLRDYGRSSRDKFQLEGGINSRLDELQAAILNIRLKYLDQCNKRRREIARIYRDAFSGTGLVFQEELQFACSVCHIFVVRVKERKKFQKHLLSKGVETAIHYPTAVCDQPAFQEFSKKCNVPVARRVVKELVSLPMFSSLTQAELEKVIDAVKSFGA